MPPVVAITVDIAPADYEALVDRGFVRDHVGRNIRRILLIIAALVSMAAVAPALLSGQRIEPIHLVFVAAAVVLAALGGRAIRHARRAAIERLTGDAALPTGPVDIVFGASGVSARSPHLSASYAWSLVSEIASTDTHLFITIGRHRSFVVPWRSWTGTHDKTAIEVVVHAWRVQATNYETRCPRCHYELAPLAVHGCPECGWGRNAPDPTIGYATPHEARCVCDVRCGDGVDGQA